jgi:hypothetical protein
VRTKYSALRSIQSTLKAREEVKSSLFRANLVAKHARVIFFIKIYEKIGTPGKELAGTVS